MGRVLAATALVLVWGGPAVMAAPPRPAPLVTAAYPEAEQARCRALRDLVLPGMTVDSATPLPPRHNVALDGDLEARVGVPFCRVRATLRPTADSRIASDIWLPVLAAWNGKLAAAGNGGFAGNLIEPNAAMIQTVARGYASSGTDTGHVGTGAGWALRHPEKIADFAWRGEHETAVAAKALIQAYYGRPARRAYFEGCSDGGREALMEAQRYPEDFDGVIAKAPAANFTSLMSVFASNVRDLSANNTPRQVDLKRVQDLVLSQCGGQDGLLADPRSCRPDLTSLACGQGHTGGCVSPQALDSIRKVYRGLVDSRTGETLYPGLAPGAEASSGWAPWIMRDDSLDRIFAEGFFRDMVYDDESWSLKRFDSGRDWRAARTRLGAVLDADNPDLGPFERRGGKLILWHGWADPAIPPLATLGYFEAVRRTMGPQRAGRFVRLFMAPGVSHCSGGPGPDSFDMLSVMDRWVEAGAAPDRVIAARYPDRTAAFLASIQNRSPGAPAVTRPVCAWPRQARYSGQGPRNVAASWRCAGPA